MFKCIRIIGAPVHKPEKMGFSCPNYCQICFYILYYICKIQLALLSSSSRSSDELRLMFMEIDIGTIINDYAIFIPSICALVLVVFIVLQLFSIYTDEMNNSF